MSLGRVSMVTTSFLVLLLVSVSSESHLTPALLGTLVTGLLLGL